MIDSLVFKNANANTAGIDLNSVINGAGISVKSFEMDVDTRAEERGRQTDHGLYRANQFLGKRVFRIEGDLMDTTATAYWTRRQLMLREFAPKAFNAYSPTVSLFQKHLGVLTATFTGMPEPLKSECLLEGWPDIPVGLAGATISPYRIALKAPDPVMYGTTLRTQNFAPGAGLTGLSALAGNAPTWIEILLTGPFTTAQVITSGGVTMFDLPFSLAAGQSIRIEGKDRNMYNTGGGEVYSGVTAAVWQYMSVDPRDPQTFRLAATGTTGASLMTITYYNAYHL